MNIITKYPTKYFKINNNVVNVLSGLSFTGEKFNKHNIEKVNLKKSKFENKFEKSKFENKFENKFEKSKFENKFEIRF